MITTNTHVYFYSGREIYSNFHRTPRQFFDPNTGLTFDSSEQAFMWEKADFFNDREICDRIAQETEPREVKKLGRLVRGYNDALWNEVREDFMVWVNLLKFSQNKNFKDELFATENRILVEASPTDCIWGVGLDQNDPLILDEKNWRGRNLLGQALMRVRTKLRLS